MVWHANSALLAILATVVSVPACADILLKEIGSFHIGGHEAVLSGQPTKEVSFTAGMAPVKVDPNGQFEIEQMYVQYFKLAAPKFRYPLLMWHGGGLTGVTWETKPDGKPGWQMFFLNRGYDVYVSDAVERGRASWARYPEFFKPLQKGGVGAVPFWAHRIIRPRSSKSPTLLRHPVPDRSARPIRQTGGSALGDERRTDAGCLRSARRTGLSLRHHRSQPGRKLWLQRSLARARQNQSACGHRAIGSALSWKGRCRPTKDG